MTQDIGAGVRPAAPPGEVSRDRTGPVTLDIVVPCFNEAPVIAQKRFPPSWDRMDCATFMGSLRLPGTHCAAGDAHITRTSAGVKYYFCALVHISRSISGMATAIRAHSS